MENVIFANFDTYLDMYEYVAQKPRAKNELVEHLTGMHDRSESAAKQQVRNAAQGKITCIGLEEEQLVFDVEKFKNTINELCSVVGLVAVIESKPTRKAKPEDSVPVVKDGHSPGYKKMKKSADDAEGKIRALRKLLEKRDEEIKALKEQLEHLTDETILKAMKQKVLVAGSAEVKPEEKFMRDFFLLSPKKLLDVSDLVSKYGGEIESPYEPVFSADKELTEENYIKRIFKQLFGGELLKRRVEEQDRLPNVEKVEPDEEKWVKRSSINRVEIERNRLESVNEILSLTEISNQVKLSLYAAWFYKDDPEMLELLNYAGEHGINADYVIRLLEKPKEFHNYRMLRGLLMQASKASEAHIKREAAMELISGEWYVEADYCGEKCRYQMVPMTELERFKEVLSQYHTKEAIEILEGILSGNTMVSQKKEELSEPVCTNDKEDIDSQIQPPDFLHQKEQASGVDCHVDLDDEVIFEQFEEEGGNKDGAE